MNRPPIPSWMKAIGAIAIVAIVALISITAASDQQSLIWLSDRPFEISGHLKDYLLIMKEDDEVTLSQSLPIRQIRLDSGGILLPSDDHRLRVSPSVRSRAMRGRG